MANRWGGVTIDCVDVERVAGFWSVLLDRRPGPTRPGWVYLGHRGDPQPRLVFQPVAEPKRGKARLHLDVVVDDIDEGIAQVIARARQDTWRASSRMYANTPPSESRSRSGRSARKAARARS
ncbi:VOC family protein [Streptomyces sp. NBC_00249]|uniref:VOC family protein n=1 Tax=Streptomyces sp. NBC_00249 TaxID=2975690 RepID=UPI00224E7CB3|nr:VOC family protein [Streptomyces sp. NBC_00249]MCX5192395.1 VOC family protein [Streptomyces sp. NBC_00249]